MNLEAYTMEDAPKEELRERLAYDLKGPLPTPGAVEYVPNDMYRDSDGEWRPLARPSGGTD